MALRRILNRVVVKKRATGQRCRTAEVGYRRSSLHLRLRRRRGTSHQLRALLARSNGRRPADAEGARLGRAGHRLAPGRCRQHGSSSASRGRPRRTSGTTRPGASAGAQPSSSATERSSRPRRRSRSTLPSSLERCATRINEVLEIESDDGPVTGLMNAFREALVHDLEPDDFADMYAQTIAYGLLSAQDRESERRRRDRPSTFRSRIRSSRS